MKYKPSRNFLVSTSFLILSFFTMQGVIVPSVVKDDLAAVARMAEIKSGDTLGVLRSVRWEEFDEKNQTINEKFLGYYLERIDGTTAKISVPKELGENLDGRSVLYNTKTGKLDIDSSEKIFDNPIGTDAVPEFKKIKTLVLLTQFGNSTPVGITAEEYEDRLFGNNGYVSKFYEEMTHGKVQFDADVRGWYTFPEPGSAYNDPSYDYCFVSDSALSSITETYQLDLYDYDMIISISNCEEYENLGGISDGTLEAQGFEFIRIMGHYDRLGVYSESSYSDWPGLVWNISHEIGHAMGDIGAGHSNGYNCQDTTLGFLGNNLGLESSCHTLQYGNPFDAMGDWGGRIFNFFMQNNAGWVSDQDILEIREGGQYFINNLQSEAGIVGAKIYIPFDDTPLFAVEHRKSTGFDSVLSTGSGSASDGLILYVLRDRVWWVVDPHPTNLPFKDDLRNDSISPVNSFNSEQFGISINVTDVTDEGVAFSVDYSDYDTSPCAVFLVNNPTPLGEAYPVPVVYQSPNYPIQLQIENLYHGISDNDASCVQSFRHNLTVIDSDVPDIIGDTVDYYGFATGPVYVTTFRSPNILSIGQHYVTVRQTNMRTGEYYDRYLEFTVSG